MKRTEIQLRLRSKIIPTKEGEALGFGFRLGPINLYIIVNIPEEEKDGAPVYIRMDLRAADEWLVTENGKDTKVRS